jgi:16S rRNA (cytidine1402-2'-O)-methyltransferase
LTGALYLVPNTLDFGCASGEGVALPDIRQVLPIGVIERASGLTSWVCENAKSARAFLKRVDAATPLSLPLQAIDIVELPRPPKGRHESAPPMKTQMARLLRPALEGVDIGLLSEAGLPAVADPGAALVQTAHELRIRVVALPGASSILLALAASGLHGQSFAFVGYLPVEAASRVSRIRELEQWSRKAQQTQICIETPYRNQTLLAALLAALNADTRLSVSCGLTLESGWSRSDTVQRWRGASTPIPNEIPAVFSFMA